MSQITQRAKYRPSGRLSWSKFLPLYLLAIVVAVAFAALMYWSFTVGWYLIFLTPFIAALLVSLFLAMAVRSGLCRNPILAGLAGLIAGAVLFLGQYYFGLLSIVGVRNALRVDYLPSYISLRVHTDTHHDVGRSDRANTSPDPYFNWGIFIVEFGAVLWMTGIMTWRRAKSPYCEQCGRWNQQDVAIFPPDSGKTFRQWLELGQIRQLAALSAYAPSGRSKRFTAVAANFCDPQRAESPCPVYLAIKDISLGGTATAFQKFDGSAGRVRVPRVQLTPDEAVSLTPIFPRLRAVARSTSAESNATSNPANLSIPSLLGGSARIDVQQLPESESRKVFNARTIAIGNILGIMTLVVFLAAIVGIGAGIYFSNILNVIDHKAQLEPLRLGIGLALSALALIVTILSGILALRNSGAPGNTYYYRRAKHFFGLRSAPLVDVNRPSDQPVFFVEIVPRKNWGKIMLETATDIGFLEIDDRRREIRFEGDRERYRIPAAAITSCRVEQFAVSAGESNIVHHAVVVRGKTKTEDWEAPFCLRQTKWNPPKNHRELGAARIFSTIAAIAPWVIPGVAERIAAGATQPGVQIPEGQSSLPMPPINFTPPRQSLFRKHGLRLTIIVVAIGFGLWRGYAVNQAKRAAAQRFTAATEIGAHRGPSLSMHLTNIRAGQKLIPQPPFFSPGGSVTVVDCAANDDDQALISIAIQPVGKPVSADIPLSFSSVTVIPTTRDQGDRFIAALARVLNQPVPAKPGQQHPLTSKTFFITNLGEHLAPPDRGFTHGGGTWSASKWFIHDDPSTDSDDDAEIFFNYDLTAGQAEFSQKDRGYNATVVARLAAILRDGIKPESATSQVSQSDTSNR